MVVGVTPKHFLGFVSSQLVFRIRWAHVEGVDYAGKQLKVALKDSYFVQPPSHAPNTGQQEQAGQEEEGVVDAEAALTAVYGPTALKVGFWCVWLLVF